MLPACSLYEIPPKSIAATRRCSARFVDNSALLDNSTSPLEPLVCWRAVRYHNTLHSNHEANTNTTKCWWQNPVRIDLILPNVTLTSYFFPQLPQARLVAGRRLVRTARQLEGQHSDHDGRRDRNHRNGMDSERPEGTPIQDARGSSSSLQSSDLEELR
jgi:hypothetical protein